MPTAPIRLRACRSRADKSRFANHSSRIARESAAPGQCQSHHSHEQQSDKPHHDGTHPVRRGLQRNRVGIVRPYAFHEDLSPGEICRRVMMTALGRSPGPASSKTFQSLLGSDLIRTEALFFVLTRFLYANRYPLRSKAL